jgi:hypothetical protein
MAGYSATPLVGKLGIRPDDVVLTLARPVGLDLPALLTPWPPGARLVARRGRAHRADVVLAFCARRAALVSTVARAREAMTTDGMVWLLWPKKSGPGWPGPELGVTEDDVRREALAAGLVDVKVCAFDETLSGLKLVYRLTDRPRARATRD